MHKQALNNTKDFINKYLKHLFNKPAKVLDVGSLNMNGSVKPLFTKMKWKYTGVDIKGGHGVDVVLSDPYKYPFKDNTFDVVVSTSCFEHNEMFWLSFREMVRVTKGGGFMYISAPYKDGIHRTPVDCWRFLPDGYKALTKWCDQAELLNSYICPRPARDCVGIFTIKKQEKK